VNGNIKQRRAAARSGEWDQHFSNASSILELTGQTDGARKNIWCIPLIHKVTSGEKTEGTTNSG